jgi:hypothetical protein
MGFGSLDDYIFENGNVEPTELSKILNLLYEKINDRLWAWQGILWDPETQQLEIQPSPVEITNEYVQQIVRLLGDVSSSQENLQLNRLADKLYSLPFNLVNPFTASKTYDDLLNANVMFIRGEFPWAPYHPAPLALETTSSGVDCKLVLLHQPPLKILTTNGQPPLQEQGVNEHGYRYKILQKSFLDGYVPKENMKDVVEIIERHPYHEIVKYEFVDNSTLTSVVSTVKEDVTLTKEYIEEEGGVVMELDYTKYKKYVDGDRRFESEIKLLPTINNFLRDGCYRFTILIDEYNTPLSVEDILLDIQ